MNIWKRLEMKNGFTATECVLAEYLLENRCRIEDLQLEDFKEHCYVSRATVYRFLGKLECDGMPALKLRLIHDRDTFEQEDKDLNLLLFTPPIDKESSDKAISKLVSPIA